MRLKYFSKQGVPFHKPKFPFGNTKESFLGKRNIIYDIDEIYRQVTYKHLFFHN
jgi:hypothetical protein